MTLDSFREYRGSAEPAGRILERLIAAIHVAQSPDIKVTWNDAINGRQFDVTIRFRNGIHDYLVVIECKDYKGPVPVEKVEAFVTKAEGAKANKAVMFSATGFQKGAIQVAKDHNVRLFTVEERFALPDASTVRLVDGAAFVSLEFDVRDSDETIAFSARSPRFGYIWRQGWLIAASRSCSVEELAKTLYPQDFTTKAVGREERYIPFKEPVVLAVPYEDAITVSAMKYAREPQQFSVPLPGMRPPGVGLDMFLQERLGLSFVVRDETGDIVQEEQLRNLPFGFDTVLSEGRFYESAALGFYYYLEKVTDEMLTWVAVETYQHDHLNAVCI